MLVAFAPLRVTSVFVGSWVILFVATEPVAAGGHATAKVIRGA